MAIALGIMFNKNLPLNFDSPYKSLSIIEFWRRWHISLGTWIKNYIYIPLGGSRNGEIKKIFNVILAMLFTGLWHGLGWTFIAWGAIHGIMLAINHQWRRLNIKIPKIFAWLMTFICVILSWVIFRAENLNEALEIINSMFNFKNIILPIKFSTRLEFLKAYGISFDFVIINSIDILTIFFSGLIALLFPNSQEIMKNFKPNLFWLILSIIFAVFSFTKFSGVSDFLYFNF